MDLGIYGKKALVCGASKGLGRGCAEALAMEGAQVTIIARNPQPLEEAAQAIRAKAAAVGGTVNTVACDITTAEGRAKALAACPEPDILVTNAGGPPPGDFRDWNRDDWIAALDAIIARGFGRIVNITSSAVKAPIDILGLSNGARSGLTGFVAGVARKTVAHNVTIYNLLPGPFDTDRLAATLASSAKAAGKSIDEVREARRTHNPAKRFGTPEEFGAFCAFICSRHAGYLTGQNILLDGGAYPGTF